MGGYLMKTNSLVLIFASIIFGCTTLAGAQWVQQNSGTTENLVGVVMLDSAKAVAIGSGNAILRTTDAGVSWFNETAQISSPYSWTAISFCDSLDGVIVGYQRVETTTDGGVSWKLATTPSRQKCLSVLCMFPGIFYVGADSGWIYFTTDTGQTWTSQEISAWPIRKIFEWTGGYVGIYQLPLYALTPYSVLSRSLWPGENTWTETILPEFQGTGSAAYDASYSYDGGPGFIIGVQGGTYPSAVILRKAMGDTTWQKDTTNFSSSLFGVSAPSANVVYACGAGGLIVQSTDGGNAWNEYLFPYARDYMPDFNAIYFYDENNGFVVGETGAIFHMSHGVDAVRQNQGVPSSFALLQNYPNPFNPTTTIHYVVLQDSYVTLKVYDVLGRLVHTLVDTWQKAGIYSVVFDASRLSSGVYFYRIKEGNLSAVKKMLVLK